MPTEIPLWKNSPQIPLHMRLAFAKLLIAAADNDVTLLIESLGEMGITVACRCSMFNDSIHETAFAAPDSGGIPLEA